MNERLLSIGIVGAGEIATKIHLPVLSATPDIRIAYIADTNGAAARAAADSFGGVGVEICGDVAALPSTDVVLLTTPVGTRRPYYELLASRGTAVLAEKPLATSLDQGRWLAGLFPPHALGCGLQRRTYAGAVIAKTCVQQQLFGPLRGIRISEGARTTKTGTNARFYDNWAAAQGGVLRDLGTHALDLVFEVTGATSARSVRQDFVFDDRIDRQVEAVLRFSGPAGEFGGEVMVSWLREADNALEFNFDHCILSVSSRPDGPVRLMKPDRQTLELTVQASRRCATTTYQAFFLEWESFLSGVRRQQPSAFAAATCLPTVAIIEELYLQAGKS